MDIREKSEPERVITDVFSTTLGNLKGWSRPNVGHGSHQFYPERLWEPVPTERWVRAQISAFPDLRELRLKYGRTLPGSFERVYHLPENFRVRETFDGTFAFEERVQE